MSTTEQIATLIEQLLEQIDQITLAHAVQSSAFLALARHLTIQGIVDLESLAIDLETLGSTQPDEGWQSGHAELAGALRLLNTMPSLRR